MTIVKRALEYSDGNKVYEGLMVFDDAGCGSRPGVLVAHTWRGRSSFEEVKALKLAELGFVGFALDMYGKGILGTSPEENAALMQPLLDDRPELQRRVRLAVACLQEQQEVDRERIAAIGFCFGGLCVLDLARLGDAAPGVVGVASFHGLFQPPGNTHGNRITAKILAMHGWDDPMAKPAAVLQLAEELTAAGADWQIHAYGGTLHAFTNPAAADPGKGLQYREEADRRSWQSLQNLLAEIFERSR